MNAKYFIIFFLIGLLLPLSGVGAQGQGSGLNIGLPPTYGEINLAAGFSPDPHDVNMGGGGSVDVSALSLGVNCYGYAANAPDIRLQWQGANGPLTFTFTSANDTVLIINDPMGNWYCNDDYNNLNPAVIFSNAPSGQYDIWISTFQQGGLVNGTLSITELGGPVQPPPNVNIPNQPAANSATLGSGFTPDPYSMALTGGGPVDASVMTPNAYGYIASTANFSLNWTPASNGLLRVFFVSSQDAVLLINTPRGEWFFNDDSYNTLNPSLDLDGAVTGQYNIWVGSFTPNQQAQGTLYITEVSSTTPATASAGVVSANPPSGVVGPVAAPGSQLNLRAGFTPDPYEVYVSGGGPLDMSAQNLGPACLGFASYNPNFQLNWTGSGSGLTFYFTSSQDTVLLINDANGQWHCNDDFVGLNPALTISNAPSGQYDIWIATFNPNQLVDGLLYITQLSSTVNSVLTCNQFSQLAVGMTARVTFTDGTPTRLRDAPYGQIVELMPEGHTMKVVGGPFCSGGFWWWEVITEKNVYGWAAEGDNRIYYIEPVPTFP